MLQNLFRQKTYQVQIARSDKKDGKSEEIVGQNINDEVSK